jgi:hypothetical protein
MFCNWPGPVLRREGKVFSTWIFHVLPLLIDAAPFLTLCAAPSPGHDRDSGASGGGDSDIGGCSNGEGPRYPGRGEIFEPGG